MACPAPRPGVGYSARRVAVVFRASHPLAVLTNAVDEFHLIPGPCGCVAYHTRHLQLGAAEAAANEDDEGQVLLG